MQPPATGTPDRVLLVSIVDINRDYLTRLAGGDQGWIICEPQVLSEP